MTYEEVGKAFIQYLIYIDETSKLINQLNNFILSEPNPEEASRVFKQISDYKH